MKVLLTLISTLFFSTSALAINTNFMTNSPLYYFTQQDWKMFSDAVDDALDHAQDGHKILWKNPDTGASGFALPSNTQGNCRNLKIFTSAKGQTNEAGYRFCKIKGEWKVIS